MYIFVDINNKQTLWKATNYKQFQRMTKAEVNRMAGGKRSAKAFPPTKSVSEHDLEGRLLL